MGLGGIGTLAEQFASLATLVLIVAGLIGMFVLIMRGKQHEHFEEAIRNLVRSKTPITSQTVINLYLGVSEKTRESLRGRDLRTLEKWLGWCLAKTASEKLPEGVTANVIAIAELEACLEEIRRKQNEDREAP